MVKVVFANYLFCNSFLAKTTGSITELVPLTISHPFLPIYLKFDVAQIDQLVIDRLIFT